MEAAKVESYGENLTELDLDEDVVLEHNERVEENEVRRPRAVVVPRATVVPRAVVVPDAVVVKPTLIPRVVQEPREPNGVFVVMKAELVQHLAMLAASRSMSRSALCRELIMRGLDEWASENTTATNA